MTDSRHAIPQSKADRTAACPDFEDLSRFVDGEVDGDRAAHIAAHVTHCAWCSGLATMIRAYFEAAAASAGTASGGPSCSTTEVLVSYLTTGLSEAERHSIDTHVRGCDQCIRTLTLLQRRLLSAEEASSGQTIRGSRRGLVGTVVRRPALVGTHPPSGVGARGRRRRRTAGHCWRAQLDETRTAQRNDARCSVAPHAADHGARGGGAGATQFTNRDRCHTPPWRNT
jgi:hypothetical protein